MQPGDESIEILYTIIQYTASLFSKWIVIISLAH